VLQLLRERSLQDELSTKGKEEMGKVRNLISRRNL